MVKEWAIYMEKDTGRFYVRNTKENSHPDPYSYIYVDSSDNKEEIKDSLLKCMQLGYDGFCKWKLEKMISEEKDAKVREILKKLK